MNTEQIEEIRKRQGLTQKQLADSIGITVTGYQKMIAANDPKFSMIEKLSKALNIDITTFVGGTKKNEVSEPSASYGKKLTYKLIDIQNMEIDPKRGIVSILLK